ncbi:hypothetical protein [Microbispora bryophytorum]|uniref:DUF2092 domain-containing protein n=1 Tax=Microbispora bryophytorum TaxID=1460882 RepID=A0A8H9H9V1_9ACTN|nr:hypothetical protein [Microbispora bryophytorum]MBD3139982.1 hypothetical protein [Microbispora bryophytorum]TQR99234.1 hypothetical protein FLX07_34195 [Microbispora bryophytorum]GGO28519.1 hypothetical protein GCM10011574_63050 [Microbispora bryophytorum]
MPTPKIGPLTPWMYGMHPLIVALALVTAAPATAHVRAAEPDPMAGLQSLLARGAGATTEFYGSASTDLTRQVRLSNGRRTYIGSGMELRGTGRVKLGRAGVIASEHVRRLSIGNKQLVVDEAAKDPYFAGVLRTVGTLRTVSVGGWQYQLAPRAKAWTRTGRASGAAAAYGDQFINVLEPATLRTLLSTKSRKSVAPWAKDRTTGRRQRIYTLTGTITLKELYRVSPSFREAAGTSHLGTSEVTWTYMYDDRGWPYRVGWRFYAHPRPKVPGLGEDRILRAHLATQYRSWDRPMAITAPRATPGRGLEVDDLSDVLSAPARRR